MVLVLEGWSPAVFVDFSAHSLNLFGAHSCVQVKSISVVVSSGNCTEKIQKY